jgi:hypothetical protein
MAVKSIDPEKPKRDSTFLEVQTKDGSPLPLSWFVSLRDLLQVIAKSQGVKEMQKVEIRICSVPFDPKWMKMVEDRLQTLENEMKKDK